MNCRKLTERVLADLAAPADRPQEYFWDSELTGFGVVVGRTGVKTFVARSWVNRKLRRVKIGVAGHPREDGHLWNVTLARAEAKKLLGKMSAGVDPNAERREGSPAANARPAGPTFRDAYEAHLDKMRKRDRSEQSIATVKKEIEKYMAAWLDRPIAELRGTDLVQLHESIKENARTREGTNPSNERGAPLANRVIAHVSACWNTLNKKLEGALGSWNPAKAVERDRLKPKRERIADEDLAGWYARVQTMRNPIQRDGLLFALFTGLRSDEVRSVRFDDISWSERSLLIPDPKGGAERAFKIPLSKTCIEILRRRQKENADHPLFPSGDGGFAFPGLDSAGNVGPIADLRQQVHEGSKHTRFPAEDVHTLRRTYESVAHEIGISELDQHVLTNHSFASHNVNATYIAQAMPHLARCQAAIEEALWKRIEPQRAEPKPAEPKRRSRRAARQPAHESRDPDANLLHGAE